MPRRKQRLETVVETVEITLGTLASKDVIQVQAATLTASGYLIEGTYGIAYQGRTVADDPIVIGIARDGINDAEIEAYYDLTGPTYPEQLDQTEIAARGKYIRELCQLPDRGDPDGVLISVRLADHKIGLPFDEDSGGWTFYAYNLGAGALVDGGVIQIHCQHLVRWNA